jgi:hypothetical protein
MVGELYLNRYVDAQHREPVILRNIIANLVDGIESVDRDQEVSIHHVVERLFGPDIAPMINVTSTKRSGIVVVTDREIIPAVKLRAMQLKLALEAEGVVGELRIVASGKTKEVP